MSSNETVPSTPCLDDALLAVYLDGRATDSERRAVESHLAECDTCREWAAETVRALGAAWPDEAHDSPVEPSRLAEDPPGGRVVPLPPRARPKWPVIVGLAAAAAIVAAIVVSRLGGPAQPSARPELKALVAAVGPHRPFEARLTGGFAFGPEAPVLRSGASGQPAATAAVREAAAQLAIEAERDRGPDALAALAAAELVLGRTAEAVTLLERATEERPDRAALWSDLAAARLVRAAFDGDAPRAGGALEAADRALALAPGLPEALFNRALALEALGRMDDARTAWRACAAAEAGSPWAAEAARRAGR